MRVMVVATRDPGGQQSGRKCVLNTMLRTLVGLGHTVELVVLTRREVQYVPPPGLTVHTVRPPGPLGVALLSLHYALSGTRALNECLYQGRRVAREIASLAAAADDDIVVADMIRTAELALGTGRPVLLDLDDLLSRRYADLRGAPETVLGYYAECMPKVASSLGAHIAVRMLGRESRVLARREVECSRRARAVSLVSPTEGSDLSAMLGKPVAWLPMAVELPAVAARPSSASAAYFTAKLDYEPNLAALRWFVDEVAPKMPPSTLPLRVIGHCPPHVRAEFADSPLSFLGYVDDLWDELRKGRLFVAPIVSGTGIKTKVLEALAVGLPVVSTTRGVEGIGVCNGESALVSDDAAEFAECARVLVSDDARADSVGAQGRKLATAGFAPAVVADRWTQVLAGLDGPAGPMTDGKPLAEVQPGHILVTGANRSGTTWAGEMLAESGALRMLHEPFNPGIAPRWWKRPLPFRNLYVCADNESAYLADVERILRGRRPVLAQVNEVRSARDAGRLARVAGQNTRINAPDRALLKDPIALFSAPWLAQRFGVMVLLMIRNPGAFASSILRMNWRFDFANLLGQPELMRDLLAPFEAAIAAAAERRPEHVDEAVLLWRIHYGVIGVFRREHPEWLTRRWEDLALEPLPRFAELYADLDLPFDDAIGKRIGAANQAGNLVHVADADKGPVCRDSRATATAWVDRLSPDQWAKIRDGIGDDARPFYADDEWIPEDYR